MLLRDYASGLIELAVAAIPSLAVDKSRIHPPYNSEWIQDPPTLENLKEHYYPHEVNVNHDRSLPDRLWSQRWIYFSVAEWDFASYILRKVNDWTLYRIGESQPPTQKETFDLFVESLSPQQQEAWNSYKTTESNARALIYDDLDWDQIPFPFEIASGAEDLDEERFEMAVEEHLNARGLDIQGLEAEIEESLDAFTQTLDEAKQKQFHEEILPFLINSASMSQERETASFDLNIAKRWILQKIIDMGWTVEQFGYFDNYVNYRGGRDTKKPERIGKKYQWLAFHEFLARLSDNFQYRGENWPDEEKKYYQGAWQIGIRDIDPSTLISRTYGDSSVPSWWFTVPYEKWSSYDTDRDWTKAQTDLPEVAELIAVSNPTTGSKWLTLDAMYDWDEPIPPIEDKYEKPRKRIWYMVKSYLVKKSDADTFFERAKKQDFMGRWMPESNGLQEVFLGEFVWSPSYKYFRRPEYGYYEWEKDSEQGMPAFVSVTVDEYYQEDHYDCSIDESIHIYTPSKWLSENMGLKWTGIEGQYFNSVGKLIAYDPSVRTAGPQALLINTDEFIAFLKANEYEVIWTLLGEKRVIDGTWGSSTHLKISGAYRLVGHEIVGNYWTDFFEEPQVNS